MKSFFVTSLLFFSGLLVSCDPAHDVGFINETNQTVQIQVLITDHFQTQPGMILNVTPGKDSTWAKFTLLPGDTVKCGQTIGEIDDEMPYKKLHIYYPGDSAFYENEAAIQKLYGDPYWDDPYMIELD